MKKEKTNRGFDYSNFRDYNGRDCRLQKSSIATQDCIWLGISKPKLTVFEENMGKYVTTPLPKTFMVDSDMHLTRNQVAELIPYLQRFVDTGEI